MIFMRSRSGSGMGSIQLAVAMKMIFERSNGTWGRMVAERREFCFRVENFHEREDGAGNRDRACQLIEHADRVVGFGTLQALDDLTR